MRFERGGGGADEGLGRECESTGEGDGCASEWNAAEQRGCGCGHQFFEGVGGEEGGGWNFSIVEFTWV